MSPSSTTTITVTTFALIPGSVLADSLAETATNPIGNLSQFQMIDQYNWETYNSDGPGNAAIVQPVIPVKLPFERAPLMITRTTLPVHVNTPNLGPLAGGRHEGLGDLTFLGLVLPTLKTKGLTIGIGPTAYLHHPVHQLIPTAQLFLRRPQQP